MVVATVQVKTADYRKVLKQAGDAGAGILAAALGMEVERIGLLGRQFVPLDTGSLRNSFWAGGPKGDRWWTRQGAGYKLGVHRFSIKFGFGRDDFPNSRTGVPTSRYARYQDEREDLRHPRGGGPHYLERAIDFNLPGMEQRMQAMATNIWARFK